MANVPLFSAAPSLCLGRIGRLSRMRRPGANGSGNVTTTVERIGRGDLQRLAADHQRVGDRAADAFVVRRLERKHHIVGRERVAVGEGDVRPQLQRVAQAVGGPRPRFGEPGLDLLRDAVQANELGVRQRGDEIGRRIALTNRLKLFG